MMSKRPGLQLQVRKYTSSEAVTIKHKSALRINVHMYNKLSKNSTKMTFSAKTVQWHNGVQNHQNGHLLPVLDQKVTGYEAVELFQ
eukprot:3324178-Ditylum_brightwellii.AAC.2